MGIVIVECGQPVNQEKVNRKYIDQKNFLLMI